MFERVARWQFPVSVALGLAAAGLWFARPALIVGAMIPVGYVAYTALSSTTATEDRLQLTRTITPAQTHPGSVVRVTLDVEHVGEGPLPDVRVVDGVPEALPVVEGSPRGAFGLRDGDSATITYSVRARYGEFEFAAARIRSTSLSGASMYTTETVPDGDTRISSRFAGGDYPLSQQTTGITGSVETDRGGEGLEFYGTRAYQMGDPANRINWRQYAKQGELTTVDYRLEEAVDVVVIVDARQTAAIAATETDPTGLELSVYAASEAIDGLLQGRNRVGLVTLGMSNPDSEDWFGWIPPGQGPELRHRIRSQLDEAVRMAQEADETRNGDRVEPVADIVTEPTSIPFENVSDQVAQVDSGGDDDISRLAARLSARAQVVVFSPAVDAAPVTLVEQLQTAGHAMSLCSPDVTASTTPGKTLAAIDRGRRLTRLRSLGVTVVDWEPTQPLSNVLERVMPTTGNPVGQR